MRATLKDKVAYGLATACELFSNFIGSFFLLFMTEVLMIPAIYAGTIFLIARVWDAINDPLMGSIADRTKPTRFGQYRHYMLVSILPYVGFFVLCFTVPNMGLTGKILWAGAMYILFGMSATIFQVAHGALNTVISTNQQDRISLGAWKDYFANICATIVGAVSLNMILHFGGGEANMRGYSMTALIYAVIAFICMLFASIVLRERVKPKRNPQEKMTLKIQVKSFAANRPAQILVLTCLFNFLSVTFRAAFTAYYALYYLNDPGMISICLTVFFSTPLIGILFVPKVTKLLDRRGTLMLANCFMIVSGILSLIAQTNFPMIIAANLFGGLSLSFTSSVVWGTMPDATDYGEWKTGVRATSFIYATATFAVKLASATSNFAAGAVLTLVGYDSALAAQPASVATGIYWIHGVLPIVVGIIALLIVRQYNLDKKTMGNILAELEERRAAADLSDEGLASGPVV